MARNWASSEYHRALEERKQLRARQQEREAQRRAKRERELAKRERLRREIAQLTWRASE
ncbi:MAG TPA: hypothetical protein VF193_01345 [Steroidobacter sp.]